MGVGHPNKKLDRMAQKAIDDMYRPGKVSSYNEPRKKNSFSINKLLLFVWFAFLIWLFISKAL